jgi:hypothetical protein
MVALQNTLRLLFSLLCTTNFLGAISLASEKLYVAHSHSAWSNNILVSSETSHATRQAGRKKCLSPSAAEARNSKLPLLASHHKAHQDEFRLHKRNLKPLQSPLVASTEPTDLGPNFRALDIGGEDKSLRNRSNAVARYARKRGRFSR